MCERNIMSTLGFDNELIVNELPSSNNAMCGIYKLTNLINGKVYIGQTNNYRKRYIDYANNKKAGYHSKKRPIELAIDKFGFQNFDMCMIYECPEDQLDRYELFFMEIYKSYLEEYGYNSRHMAADGTVKETGKSRRLKSKAHIGLKESADTKRKKSNKIYALKGNLFIIADSGKLFGDLINKPKDIIKNGLRVPAFVNGFALYYANLNKRQEVYEKVINKKFNRVFDIDTYVNSLEYINNSSVETIEKERDVIYLTYENLDEVRLHPNLK